MLTALIGGAFAISNVVEALYPGLGGVIGPGIGPPEVRGIWLIFVELLISLLIVGALPQPRALPWWVAVIGVAAIAANSLVNTPRLPRIGDTVCALIMLVVLLWNRRAWPWRTDRSSLRPVGLILLITLVCAALTSVAIWAVRAEFRPEPDLLQILRQAVSRFTFTTGPLVPSPESARGVLAFTGAIWALILIGWLIWALYVRAPGGWRGAREAIYVRPGRTTG